MNLEGAERNPVSKREAAVLNDTRDLLTVHFEELADRTPDDDELDRVMRRMVIAPIDVEAGTNVERAVLAVIGMQARRSPDLIWAKLDRSGCLARK